MLPRYFSIGQLKPRYRTPGLGSPGISAAPRDGPGRSRARQGSRAPWAVSSLSTSVTLPNSSRVANKTTFLSATCACVPSSASGQPAVVHLWQPEKSRSHAASAPRPASPSCAPQLGPARRRGGSARGEGGYQPARPRRHHPLPGTGGPSAPCGADLPGARAPGHRGAASFDPPPR